MANQREDRGGRFEMAQRLQDSSAAVLTEYRGLTVAQLTPLRHSLGDDATTRS